MPSKTPESKKQNKDHHDKSTPYGQAKMQNGKQQPGKKSSAGAL